MSRSLRRLASVMVVVFALSAPAYAAAADGYVALGDSYSSGVGTGSYSLNNSCKRSTYAYPYLVALQRPNTALTFVACSGATTTTVLNTQVPSITSTTTLVSVTAGGNDLGFASLISKCVQSDCNAALNATRTTADTTLGPRLDTLYETIKDRAAPGARVLVLGYPRLFSTASCFGTTGITSTERQNANLLSDEIDRLTASHAAAAGVLYRSATTPFTGHAVCSGSAWLNGLNIFNSTESFHPNRTGQSSGYLPLARSALG